VLFGLLVLAFTSVARRRARLRAVPGLSDPGI
jgi:hypothetical protein